MNSYIADFYCHAVKLVIELDGNIHEDITQQRYDQEREHELRNFGVNILRFKNEEVYQNIEVVLKIIWDYLTVSKL